MKVVLLYEFWRYDIPTEVAKGILEELRIPYKEIVVKRRRNSLHNQPYDEWSKIYVKDRDLTEWLKKEINRRIRDYGR